MSDDKNSGNFLLASVISIGILMIWQAFIVETPPLQTQKTASQQISPAALPQEQSIILQTRAEALEKSRKDRLPIQTDYLSGSINLQGARLDDLLLEQYNQTTQNKEKVILFSPGGTQDSYFADFSYILSNGGEQKISLPDSKTLWQCQGSCKLTDDQPVQLNWISPDGLLFERQVALDDRYMFTITDKITNQSGQDITLIPYGLLKKNSSPSSSDSAYIVHEGALAWMEDRLHEFDWEDISAQASYSDINSRGWLGFTDRYWMSILIPDGSFRARFWQTGGMIGEGKTPFQTDYLADNRLIAAGKSISQKYRLFAGAKEASVIDKYEQEGVIEFDYTIDWGWFWFLTQPIFSMLAYLHNFSGSFAVSLLLMTLLLKLALFPLTNKSYYAMQRIRELQPKILELKEKHQSDPTQMQQAMFALYKKEKVNPASGCLPLLVQIPIFFALYKVFLVSIEMRQAPFWGWIEDMSVRDPLNLFNLFGLLSLELPEFLHLGLWPIIMGITMFWQQKLSPAPSDPVQARVMKYLPILFCFILSPFAAGLVIYWSWSNILSILQQLLIVRLSKRPDTCKKGFWKRFTSDRK